MKKILAFLLIALTMMGLFASCETKDTIVIGYTVYKPMNYADSEGNLIGFDTDLAKAVFEEKLGYHVIFKEIDWNNKYIELNSGTIQCIWNGFTANTSDPDGIARSEKVDFSYNYMLNRQVVVTTKAIAETIADFSSLSGKIGGVEEGSAGDTHLKSLKGSIKKSFASQLDALKELTLGTVDFVVLDEQLADAYVGEGDYKDFVVADILSGDPEYYAIGFKKGSNLTAKVNGALEALAAEGKIAEIANRYNLVTAITDFTDQKNKTIKKEVVVGYTVYKPMNYTDANGMFVGFDTDLAKAVFEDELGSKVIFKEIDWNQRYLELEVGTIDCIWNGFTANTSDEDGKQRKDKVDFSYNYMLNRQVVVTTKALAETITDSLSLAGKVGGVEEGSAGATHLGTLTGSIKKSCASQLDALRELFLGTVDFAILDEHLANAYVGEGDFSNLTVVDIISGDTEYYAVGFKKGSDLKAKVNAALENLAAEGKIDEIAARYHLATAITDFSSQK